MPGGIDHWWSSLETSYYKVILSCQALNLPFTSRYNEHQQTEHDWILSLRKIILAVERKVA